MINVGICSTHEKYHSKTELLHMKFSLKKFIIELRMAVWRFENYGFLVEQKIKSCILIQNNCYVCWMPCHFSLFSALLMCHIIFVSWHFVTHEDRFF